MPGVGSPTLFHSSLLCACDTFHTGSRAAVCRETACEPALQVVRAGSSPLTVDRSCTMMLARSGGDRCVMRCAPRVTRARVTLGPCPELLTGGCRQQSATLLSGHYACVRTRYTSIRTRGGEQHEADVSTY